MNEKTLEMENLTEKDFDNLFDAWINLITKNKTKELVSSIFEIYEIKEYIPEIKMIEKHLDSKLIFKYNNIYEKRTTPKLPSTISTTTISNYNECEYDIVDVFKGSSIDLPFTLRSIYTFFSIYYFNEEITEYIDKSSVSQVILPSLELVLSYITKHCKTKD